MSTNYLYIYKSRYTDVLPNILALTIANLNMFRTLILTHSWEKPDKTKPTL